LPAVQSGGDVEPTAEILAMPLPELEEIRIAGWPKKRERLARAALAVTFEVRGWCV
jgi:hypothetical protein